MATGLKTIVLPEQTMAGKTVNRKVVIDYRYVKTLTSATGQPVIPEQPTISATATYTMKANTLVKNFLFNVKTAFATTADTITLVADLGLTGGDTDVFSPTELNLKSAGWVLGLETASLFTSADSIDLLATAGVQAITLLTAGVLEIYFFEQDLNDLATIT